MLVHRIHVGSAPRRLNTYQLDGKRDCLVDYIVCIPAIELLHPGQEDAARPCVVPCPVAKESQSRGNALLPDSCVDGRDQRGTLLRVHSRGTLRQDYNCAVSRSCQLLQRRNDGL